MWTIRGYRTCGVSYIYHSRAPYGFLVIIVHPGTFGLVTTVMTSLFHSEMMPWPHFVWWKIVSQHWLMRLWVDLTCSVYTRFKVSTRNDGYKHIFITRRWMISIVGSLDIATTIIPHWRRDRYRVYLLWSLRQSCWVPHPSQTGR